MALIANGNAPPRQPNSREQGVALIVVLWIVAVGTMLVAAFNATVRSGAAFVASEIKLSNMDNVLDAGLEIAATRLLEKPGRWRADGKSRTVAFGGATLKIRIDDPNGLIDLNKTPENLLAEFFGSFAGDSGQAKQIVSATVAARKGRTGKDAPQRVPGDPDAPGVASGLPFVDVGQLRNIPGMTMPLFRRVQPFLTVVSNTGEVDGRVAPPEIVAAVPSAKKDESNGQSQRRPSLAADASADDEPEAGPAYIVSVQASTPNAKHTSGKTYVIAVGLPDTSLPYRLLSVRPTVSAGK
jgi:general secretion pathway protein K